MVCFFTKYHYIFLIFVSERPVAFTSLQCRTLPATVENCEKYVIIIDKMPEAFGTEVTPCLKLRSNFLQKFL